MVDQDDEVSVGVSGTPWGEVDVRRWGMQEILALERRAVEHDRKPGFRMDTSNTWISRLAAGSRVYTRMNQTRKSTHGRVDMGFRSTMGAIASAKRPQEGDVWNREARTMVQGRGRRSLVSVADWRCYDGSMCSVVTRVS